MRSALVVLLCAGVCLAANPEARIPVLVELFTSQGCSSCPPADELLARLSRQPVPGVEIIALSEHVDYWNHLGWEDPHSAPAFGDRQTGYGRLFQLEGVYTPQMVINGRAQVLGSDEPNALELIRNMAAKPRIAVRVTGQDFEKRNGSATLRAKIQAESLGPLTKDEVVDIVLAVTETSVTLDVSRGENAGRRMRNTNVVRSFAKIAELNPGDPAKAGGYSAEIRVPLSRLARPENARLVVFAQERSSRRVLGAATFQVRPTHLGD